MYRQKHIKSSSFIICCILILNLVLSITTVYAEGNTIVLNDPDESEFQAFTVENMFPGDEISQEYVLNISHKKEDIKDSRIMFNVDVREGSEDLAEVLKLKVEISGEEAPLYNDLMKEMPNSLPYTLSANQEKVTYLLTVYLDTSVGNKSEKDPDGTKYQNKTLNADFSWSYYVLESTGDGGGGSGGGGSSKPSAGPTKMLRRAYVVGRPNNKFEPDAPITRAETATIFARIFADYNEDNLISTDTKFNDVTDADWFAKYISRCEDENIIFGYEGYFRPSENITRAEFAAICVRFFEKRSGSTIKPEDIRFIDFESSHWAYDTIKKAYANKYVAGYPDGTLRADNIITRAEAVTIVNKMLERIPDKEYIDNNLDKLIDFVDVRDNNYWAYYNIFEAANTHYVQFVNGFAKWVD